MPPLEPRRWKADCEAQKFLEQLWDQGEISPSDKPEAIFNQYKEFNKHFELATFRSHLNKLRHKRGATRKIIIMRNVLSTYAL